MPYVKTPTMFIEVGSTEEEWKKIPPATIVAKSLINLFEKYHYEEDMPKDIPVLMGIGGGHYAPRFTDVILEKKAAFGHMIPRYHIDAGNINIEMFEQAKKMTPNTKNAYLHRKSLKKSQIREYKKCFEELGIPVISSKELNDL